MVSEKKREAKILLMKPHACLEYFLLDPFFFHIVPVITLWREESLIKTSILIKYFRSYLQKNFSFEPLVCAWYRICKRNSSYCGLASICHPLPHEVQDESLIKSNRKHWQNSDICLCWIRWVAPFMNELIHHDGNQTIRKSCELLILVYHSLPETFGPWLVLSICMLKCFYFPFLVMYLLIGVLH